MIGQTASHYRILEKLGGGGMGLVYKAEDTKLHRFVALKFLPEALTKDRQALERFRREARAASSLNHPNICTVYDIDESGGRPFIAMEVIDGRTLRAMMDQRFSVESLARVGQQIAKALSVAHAAGIVHRDIKPENVMVRADGYVKVLDFGLARLTPTVDPVAETAEDSGLQTSPGTLLGTVRYMSPEQAQGQTTSSATDLFSFGTVLYELATGQHPFAAESHAGVLHAILSQSPLLPSRLNPEVPAPLDAVILQMIEKDPRLRPTAAEVDTALAEVAGKGAAARISLTVPLVKRHTVGREKERAELRAGFESAASGSGLLMCVAGEPGIGKTTLVEDFLAEISAAGQSCYIARGRCSERLAGTEAYLPFLEALESLLHSEAGAGLSRIMKLVAPTWYVQITPLSADDSSAARMLADVKTASQERMKRELGTFIQEASRLRPLILFFDDVHWADASTVDLLIYLGTKFDSIRLLMVATYRPTDLLLAKHPFLQVKLDLQARSSCRDVSLDFLSRGDIETYLALEFPGHRFPADFAALIHTKTEGSPLFMVDLLRYLRDRKVIAEEQGAGRWRKPCPTSSASFPSPCAA